VRGAGRGTCTQLLLHATTHSLVSRHMPTGAPLSSMVVAVRSLFLMQYLARLHHVLARGALSAAARAGEGAYTAEFLHATNILYSTTRMPTQQINAGVAGSAMLRSKSCDVHISTGATHRDKTDKPLTLHSALSMETLSFSSPSTSVLALPVG
jgi:hypothetical protein